MAALPCLQVWITTPRDRSQEGLSLLRVASRLPLLAVLAALWACTSATPAPTPTATPTAGPEIPAAVVLASPVPPPHLDVHQEVAESLISLGPGISYSRLLRIRSGPGADPAILEVECDLCIEWDILDPLTYLFRLRPDVLWHDLPPVNGRPLTAADVVFSLDRLRTPGWPGASLLQAIASVEATDQTTVTVRLSYPDADLLLALANGQSKIVAPEAVAQAGDLRDGPTIGTGPWVLDEMGPDGARFSANPAYYEPGLPGLERLTIVPIPDASNRLAALLTGLADITIVDPEDWDRLLSSPAPVQGVVFPQPGTGLLLGLNVTRPPFNRLDVRQALFQSLDPWQALDTMWQGHGQVGLGLPAPSSDWPLALNELRMYLGNSDVARSLLAGAGVELPVAFTLTVADFGPRHLALAGEYQRMLEQTGFQATLNPVNPRVYAEEVWDARDFDAFLGPMPPVHTPNAFLFGLLHSQGRWSPTGYSDAELDSLIESQAAAQEGRSGLIRQLQTRVLEQAVLFTPITGTSLWAWQDRIEGFQPAFGASEYLHWARLTLRNE